MWICYHSLYALPAVPVIAAFYLSRMRKKKTEEKKRLMNYHFKDFLSALHTALQAGYSLENGIQAAYTDIEKLYGKEDVLAGELREILRQMKYQRPVENLFWELGLRTGIEDIQSFGEVLIIAKRTGGNISRILQDTWRNLCEKIDTAREIGTMTAARQYEQNMMSLMPAGIVLYLKITFPGLIDKLYGNLFGAAVMTGCLLVYLAAVLLGRYLLRKDSASLFG